MVAQDALVGKAQMIGAAMRAEFGTQAALTRMFTEFQQLGLLGKAIARAPRRGGEGLWHPIQAELWLDLLRRRLHEQIRPTTLANLPVGLWLLGMPGIETAQAQRAFEFWAGYLTVRASNAPRARQYRLPKGTAQSWSARRPTGSRSLQHRAMEERIDALSAPEASTSAKRELRLLLEIVNSGIEVSPDSYISRVLEVLAPDGNPTPEQRSMAATMSKGVALQRLALTELDHLVVPSGTDLWEWGRRAYQRDLPSFETRRREIVENPVIGHLFRKTVVEETLQGACNAMLTTLGIGIACLRGVLGMQAPPGEDPPPPIPGVRT